MTTQTCLDETCAMEFDEGDLHSALFKHNGLQTLLSGSEAVPRIKRKRRQGKHRSASYYGRLRRGDYNCVYEEKLPIRDTEFYLRVYHCRTEGGKAIIQLARLTSRGPTTDSLCFDEDAFWKLINLPDHQLSIASDGDKLVLTGHSIVGVTQDIVLFRTRLHLWIFAVSGKSFQGLFLTAREFSEFRSLMNHVKQRTILKE